MLVTTWSTPVDPQIFRQLLSTHVLVIRQSSNELKEFEIQLTSARYYKDESSIFFPVYQHEILKVVSHDGKLEG